MESAIVGEYEGKVGETEELCEGGEGEEEGDMGER